MPCLQQVGQPHSATEQTSPSGRKVDIKMQTLGRGDPAGSDSEASDTDAPSVSGSHHQQKVQSSCEPHVLTCRR